MFRVTVLYPHDESRPFNRAHYLEVHIPLTVQRLGAHIERLSVEFGISGGVPGSLPHFAAIATFDTSSLDAFKAAFAEHAKELGRDLPNYSAVPPKIQYSEVVLPK